ncbi:unnamed protein product [Notodromas monacha]|nr:unnamed protein product [Notodromas monacha]CAG0918245.1 unnamed protein product [Notodromas monacha]
MSDRTIVGSGFMDDDEEDEATQKQETEEKEEGKSSDDKEVFPVEKSVSPPLPPPVAFSENKGTGNRTEIRKPAAQDGVTDLLRDELLMNESMKPKIEAKDEVKKMQLDRKKKAAEFLAKLMKKPDSLPMSNVHPGQARIAQESVADSDSSSSSNANLRNPETLAQVKDLPIFETTTMSEPEISKSADQFSVQNENQENKENQLSAKPGGNSHDDLKQEPKSQDLPSNCVIEEVKVHSSSSESGEIRNPSSDEERDAARDSKSKKKKKKKTKKSKKRKKRSERDEDEEEEEEASRRERKRLKHDKSSSGGKKQKHRTRHRHRSKSGTSDEDADENWVPSAAGPS